ncbi:MAG: phage baseplate assembly protein V [Klebsiella huaxiensis]|uniref:phage baseplate assembly protein V n=1 Tax=Klebsiella huaxiensis TaxID=2153354 RepID=UPI0026EEF0F2|nr:phage baseplate assembly protein V [Klebsiella huaxiensis]WEJ88483.1 MAG: phage baseplate assembly protein V [Klebsiella huaxiensis]
MNAELMRLLENILRQGVVEQISADAKAVRVRSGRLLTDLIRWNVTRAGAFSIWLPPSIGEQVWIGCPGGNPESAFVIGSVYSADNPATGSSLLEISITAPDGARLHYDAADDAGALSVTGVKTARIQAETRVTLDAPEVECTNLLKTRTFELTDGGTMAGDVTHLGGAFTSNGVQVDNHGHGAVQRGGSWTEGTK